MALWAIIYGVLYTKSHSKWAKTSIVFWFHDKIRKTDKVDGAVATRVKNVNLANDRKTHAEKKWSNIFLRIWIMNASLDN